MFAFNTKKRDNIKSVNINKANIHGYLYIWLIRYVSTIFSHRICCKLFSICIECTTGPCVPFRRPCGIFCSRLGCDVMDSRGRRESTWMGRCVIELQHLLRGSGRCCCSSGCGDCLIEVSGKGRRMLMVLEIGARASGAALSSETRIFVLNLLRKLLLIKLFI